MSEQTPEIYNAINAVMQDVGAVKKDQRNNAQNFNFRGIDNVINAVYPAFVRHGVFVTPRVVEKHRELSTTGRGGTIENIYLTVDVVFHALDGSHLTATVAAQSFDSGDKATAKAMSVALRTALLQVLALPTDEPDPDAVSYQRAPVISDQERADRATVLQQYSQKLGKTSAEINQYVAYYGAQNGAPGAQWDTLTAEQFAGLINDFEARISRREPKPDQTETEAGA